MKKIWSLILLMLLVNLSSGTVYFRLSEPSSINVRAGEDANFTVAIKSLGSEGRYVNPIFRNLPDGALASYGGALKWIDPGGRMDFSCHLNTKEVPPGNYSFEIGVSAVGAPANWQRVNLTVEEPKALESKEQPASTGTEQPLPTTSPIVGNISEKVNVSNNVTEEVEKVRAIPGFGAAFLAAIIIFIWLRESY